VIALNSFVGFVGYLGHIPMDWVLIGAFIFAAGLGIVIGSSLVKRVSAAGLKRGFAVFLVVVGTFILFCTKTAVLSHKFYPLRRNHAKKARALKTSKNQPTKSIL
jgi:uncharacterized protein